MADFARDLERENAALVAALESALIQLETLGGVRRKHPIEGQDEIHAEVLEQIDAALALARQA